MHMVFSRRLDGFLVLRRGPNAQDAKRANFAKRLKIRVVRLMPVIRVERFLVLEKTVVQCKSYVNKSRISCIIKAT